MSSEGFDAALDELRRAAEERPDDPSTLSTYAEALAEHIQSRWGYATPFKDEDAPPVLRAYADATRRLAAVDPTETGTYVEALGSLSELHLARGELDAASGVLDEMLSVAREAVAADPVDPETSGRVADALEGLARVAHERKDAAAEGRLRDESLAVRRELAATEADARFALAEALDAYAGFAASANRPPGASALREEQIVLLRALVAEEPGEDLFTSSLSWALEERATARREAGRLTDARADIEEAVTILCADQEAGNDVDGWLLAGQFELLAGIAEDQEDWAGALRASEERAALLRQVLARPSPSSFAELDLGHALTTIGDMKRNLGDWRGAYASYELALSHHRGLAARRADEPVVAGRLASGLGDLGRAAAKLGDVATARRFFGDMRTAYAALAARFPGDEDAVGALPWHLKHAATFLDEQAEDEAALELWRQRLAVARVLAAPGDSPWHRDRLRIALLDLGRALADRGSHAEAAGVLREAAEMVQARPANDPDRPLAIANTLAELRDVLAELGEKSEALEAAREAAAARRQVAAGAPHDLGLLRELLVDLDELGDLDRDASDHAGAASAYEEAEALARGLVATDPQDTQWRDDLSIVLGRRARLALDRGDAPGAAALYAESAEELRVLAGQEPEISTWRGRLGRRLADRGEALLDAGDREGALAAYEEAVGLLVGTRGSEGGATDDLIRETLSEAADAASSAGRPDLAAVFRTRASEIGAAGTA